MVTIEKYNAILNDLGVDNPEARQATIKHCQKLLEPLDHPMIDLQFEAGEYYDGYLDCLKAHDLA